MKYGMSSREAKYTLEEIRDRLDYADHLTAWELDFIDDIEFKTLPNYTSLTAKQAEKLENLRQKVCGDPVEPYREFF